MMELENLSLTAGYQPNDHVLKKMAGIELVATVAPSASGKTTIMNKLVESDPSFAMVIDETTRPPRPGEVPGRDFIFISREQALADIKTGDLVQAALGPNGDIYCTRPSSYPQAKIGLIALVPAAVREFRRLPIKKFSAAFIVPADFNKWLGWFEAQATSSGWDDAKRAARLAEAKASYEFALSDTEIHFVLNDDVPKSVQRLGQVAAGQTSDDEERSKAIAAQNLKMLNKRTAPNGS